MQPSRRSVAGAAAVTATLALAACSAGSPGTSDATSAASGRSAVTFRLWDEVAAPAYEESFDAFMAANPGILVEVEVVPWDDYWERLRLDLASGEMADVFWTNSSNVDRYAESGDLIDLTEVIGGDHDAWERSVVSLYTDGGSLWGVPQLWDSVALYYNQALADEAGVEPATLAWAPSSTEAEEVGADDTLLKAARALTTDDGGRHPGEGDFDAGTVQTFGFNAQGEVQAVYTAFLAQNGARFQDADGFTFATADGAEAFGYLVDLVDAQHVAPSAAGPATDDDDARDLFLQGRLGLFQSSSRDLRTISEDADFAWALAAMVAGPRGRIGVVDGVAAVGNARTEDAAATTSVLRWLGSADGQTALASQGVAFPAAVDAQQTFIDYWAGRGVDVGVFVDAARAPVTPAPADPDDAGVDALAPVLHEMFLGAIPVPEALTRAQDAGNEAITP